MKSVGSGGNSISISLYPSSMAAPVDFCAAAMHCGNVDGTGSRASSETGAAAGADEDRAARRDELAIAGDRAARRRAGLRALGRMNAMAVPQNWRRIADRMVVGLAEVVVLTGYRLSWPENGGALKTAIGLAMWVWLSSVGARLSSHSDLNSDCSRPRPRTCLPCWLIECSPSRSSPRRPPHKQVCLTPRLVRL